MGATRLTLTYEDGSETKVTREDYDVYTMLAAIKDANSDVSAEIGKANVTSGRHPFISLTAIHIDYLEDV